MDCSCGNPGKYKCPRCLIRYCSKDCYSAHKNSGCERKREPKFTPIVRHPHRNFLLEDEDETILTDEELSQMRLNQTLKTMLKNEEVRKLLNEIDSSENRLGALRSVLLQDKDGNSTFQQCMDEMLKSLGYLNEEGQSTI
ncbi:unnamed protein product [Blepharisma stoltei]|uniref:HIT-type domain-containing protein n=1 Tax=Blepharisma stoltei TaxID=1481888 RepID=A0AAU9IJZ3_9CILI|nr:unnamed protein product [Blepharisma stoltei]